MTLHEQTKTKTEIKKNWNLKHHYWHKGSNLKIIEKQKTSIISSLSFFRNSTMSTGAIVKPKSKAYKRFLENREPKLIENDKTCLFLRGGNSSAAVTKVMSTFHSMMKPNAVQFHQKNMLRPFEDPSSLEFFAERNDASLFCFGSHSKKRPHNLVFGRFHNNSLLDMVELCVNYCNIPNKLRIPTAIKPMLSFTGEGWTDNAELERVRNIDSGGISWKTRDEWSELTKKFK